jgi:hypothetical protein
MDIRRSYQAQLTDARPEAKALIARELLTRSAIAQDPVRELASLRVAAELATEAQDFAMALEACGKMGERFEMATLPTKVELLAKGSHQNALPGGSARLADACIATGFEALAQDEYEQGIALADMGKSAAQASANRHLIKQAQWLETELTRCRTGYAQVKKLVERLRQQPGNAEANLRVGEFLCFTKNDWQIGLPMVAHGNDEGLRSIVEKELGQKSLKPPEQVALGDRWWALAAASTNQLQLAFQRRARYWYLKAIAQARGAEKARLREQLAERMKTTSPVGEVHIFSRVNGVDHITLFSDEARWFSGRGSLNDRINHVLIGELKPRGTKLIKNCGATRLFPEGVDFQTAQLIINHKGRRRGTASLEVAEDHVRIDLADQPLGFSDLEVTITFGQP